MSIVDRTGDKPPRRGVSEGSSLSSLLGSILDTVASHSISLPDVAGGDDLDLYRQNLNNMVRAAEIPTDLDERKRRGRAVRFRALDILRKLSAVGTSTRAITRGQWTRMYNLALFCARDQDWCSTTGPVIGATGDKLRAYLHVMNLRDVFDPLLASGLIVPHRRRGNGRRYFAVINANTASERVEASGWSLAPLMFILDELEILYQHETDLFAERCRLPASAKKSIKHATAALKPYESQAWARNFLLEADSIANRVNDARKGRLAKLRALENDAHLFRLRVEEAVDKLESGDALGRISPHSSGVTIPDIYNSKNHIVSSNCSAGERSDACGPPPSPLADDGGADHEVAQDDPFGIERSGFTLAEAPALFPFSDGLLDLTTVRPEASAHIAARLMSVAPSSVSRSLRQIGLLPTLLCLLITGQHASDGEIRATPDIYFQGLIKRARQNELNIGHTIFGRRAGASTQRSKASAINQVGTHVCYG